MLKVLVLKVLMVRVLNVLVLNVLVLKVLVEPSPWWEAVAAAPLLHVPRHQQNRLRRRRNDASNRNVRDRVAGVRLAR